MKYLVLLIVLGLAYLWWRNQRIERSAPPRRQLAPPQDIVACVHCGVHVPRQEALTHGTLYYCCKEHQRADGR